jgi:hypothetical protein
MIASGKAKLRKRNSDGLADTSVENTETVEVPTKKARKSNSPASKSKGKGKKEIKKQEIVTEENVLDFTRTCPNEVCLLHVFN